MPKPRRYDVTIGGHRHRFHYAAGRYRFRFSDVPYSGPAATLCDAKHHVRRIIRAALATQDQAGPGTRTSPGSCPGSR
jgi:hypothetical protein